MKPMAYGIICCAGLLFAGCGGDSENNGTNKTINPIVSTAAPSGSSSDATAAGGEQVDCSADENTWTPMVAGESYEMDCEATKE